MKTFAFSAALLASTAVALPTRVLSAIPSGIPSCLPSGVIPSGIPLPVLSMVPTCSGVTPTATPAPSSAVSSMASSGSSGAGQILSVLNQAGTSQVEMMAENELKSLLSKIPLSELQQPVGQILETAESVGQLNGGNGAGLGQITAVLENGNVALIQLTQKLVDLLDSLGLGQVGSLLGSIVGGLESVTGNVKRDPISDALSITDLNGLVGGKNLLVQVEPTVLGLLGGLDLTSLQDGPIGNVVATATSLSGLKDQVPQIPGASFIAVHAQDFASVLLVQVDSAVEGLLSTLGLGGLSTIVGSVVPAV
ncbi:hypothetical protein PENANT_c024G00570 [Penicillium antarcticum]|uniref:Bacterial collagen-like protein middle domain-containing protein n=1 Tax=Penicillium antarcticum TaxID=416450 RepID=A0A1V6PY81_9EURO|nr:uncharacterized protein N7508_005126 [Penicillium antarcticum]KAJ5306111.1 hypothetical protein N7508_005126 [Penicillium antarcticum]OQD81903.1 hypothetical protein PENANT_c024G00570 [Penicillium antarcticum]